MAIRQILVEPNKLLNTSGGAFKLLLSVVVLYDEAISPKNDKLKFVSFSNFPLF